MPPDMDAVFGNKMSRDMNWWEIVPSTYEELTRFAAVIPKMPIFDYSRRHHVVYASDFTRAREIYPVTYKLTGILSDFCLTPLGNTFIQR